MSDNLLQQLPPELHARYLKSSEGMTPTGLRLRFGLQDAMREEPREPRTEASRMAAKFAADAMNTWQDIHKAHWSSVADPTTDKRAAFLRSAQFAKQGLAKLAADYSVAIEAIEEKAKHLNTVLKNARAAPSSYGDALIDSEVRAMIRAETDPGKAMAIASAHPRAVASLPSGIAAQLVGESGASQLVRQHLEAVAPDALADNDDLREALEQLSRADKEVRKQANGLIDFDAAAAMERLGKWQPPAREAA